MSLRSAPVEVEAAAAVGRQLPEVVVSLRSALAEVVPLLLASVASRLKPPEVEVAAAEAELLRPVAPARVEQRVQAACREPPQPEQLRVVPKARLQAVPLERARPARWATPPEALLRVSAALLAPLPAGQLPSWVGKTPLNDPLLQCRASRYFQGGYSGHLPFRAAPG
ncbi:MAG: hypothetical protein ACOY0T_02050 [Myxococcota bacterium]